MSGVEHDYQMTRPDRGDESLGQPSDWNAPHTVSYPVSLGGGGVTLTNVGSAYDTTQQSQGLGGCTVQFDSINRIRFGVKVNKVGTGTQSWQLWNETDGVEIGVIDDAGGAGVKALEVVIEGAAIPTGIKFVRVRAKSTVAADDPVYFAGTILLQHIRGL